jgi:tyrosyl-tRNA synthetase
LENFLNKITPEQRVEMKKQFAIYSSGTKEIIPEIELLNKIAKSIFEKKPMKIKLGLDPSAPDIHLGHTVVLNKLKQFQDNGHTIQVVIGDFTG